MSVTQGTVLNEIVYGLAYKKVLEARTDFLDLIPDQSSKITTSRLGNPLVVVADVTPMPEVLVNHVGNIPDMDLTFDGTTISMAKLDTKNTPITDDEQATTSIDLAKQTIENHAISISEKRKAMGVYALAPMQDTTSTPVVATTGATTNTRGFKKFTEADLSTMYARLADEGTPEDGLIAVLSRHHIQELCEASTGFGGFNQLWQARTPGQPVYYGGFTIYGFNTSKVVCYDLTGAKKAFGATMTNTDRRASLFFNRYEMAKFETPQKIYTKNSSNDPTTRSTTIGVRKYALVIPIMGRSYGAIYEG